MPLTLFFAAIGFAVKVQHNYDGRPIETEIAKVCLDYRTIDNRKKYQNIISHWEKNKHKGRQISVMRLPTNPDKRLRDSGSIWIHLLFKDQEAVRLFAFFMMEGLSILQGLAHTNKLKWDFRDCFPHTQFLYPLTLHQMLYQMVDFHNHWAEEMGFPPLSCSDPANSMRHAFATYMFQQWKLGIEFPWIPFSHGMKSKQDKENRIKVAEILGRLMNTSVEQIINVYAGDLYRTPYGTYREDLDAAVANSLQDRQGSDWDLDSRDDSDVADAMEGLAFGQGETQMRVVPRRTFPPGWHF